MLSIKNNQMAQNAARHLGRSYAALAQSVERLASGLRINSARDDAAGLAVRELIRADVAALRQGSRNAADAVSMLQTAEGGLAVVDDLLVRMRELAEQASNGSYSAEQRSIMDQEFQQLADEVTRIATNTKFNGNNLLIADQAGAMTISLGSGVGDSGQVIQVDSANVTSSGLGLGAGTVTQGENVNQSYSISGQTVANGDAVYLKNLSDADAVTLRFTIDGLSKDITIGTETDLTLNALVTQINAAFAGEEGDNGEFTEVASVGLDGTDAYLVLTADNFYGETTMSMSVTAGALHWSDGTTAVAGTELAVDQAGSAEETVAVAAAAIDTAANAADAISRLEDAIRNKDIYRAHLGYIMNRLESAAAVIDIQAENLAVAESRISDVDVATEVAAMTRTQVLANAGISMLSQANSLPQMALQLLRG